MLDQSVQANRAFLRWRFHLAAVCALLLVLAIATIGGVRPRAVQEVAATADAGTSSSGIPLGALQVGSDAPVAGTATTVAAAATATGTPGVAAGTNTVTRTVTAAGPTQATAVAGGPAVTTAAKVVPGTTYDTGASDTEVRVGGSTFTSGPAAVYGEQIAVGFAAGIDYVNSKGGINGRKVTLKVYDDGADPAKQLANTKRLVEVDKVFALAMSYANVTGDYVASKGIPVFHLGQNQEEFTNPWWFPVGGPQRTSGYLLSKFVAGRGVKSVAIFYIDAGSGVYSKAYAQTVAKDFNAYGIKADVQVGFAPDQTSCSDAISAASNAKVDFIDFEIDASKVINCGVQAQVQGYTPPKFWGGYLIGVPVIHEALGDFSQHMLAFDAFGANYDAPDYVNEVKKVSSKTETYSSVTASYFVSALLLRDSMSKLGTNFTRVNLRDVLNTFTDWTPGLTTDPNQPTWTWRPQCHVSLKGGYVIEIQKNPADGKLKWTQITPQLSTIDLPPGEGLPPEFSGCTNRFTLH